MGSYWHFDFYSSPAFWLVLPVVVALVRVLGTTSGRKALVLLFFSSALILAIPDLGIGGLAAVWGFAGATLAVASSLTRPGDGRGGERRLTATLGILAVLGFLAFFKYPQIQALFLGPGGDGSASDRVPGLSVGSRHLFLIGVSYFSFKAIHTIVEAYRRSIPVVDGLTYLNYITFFPSFVSGPISRYPQFAEQMPPAAPGSWKHDLAEGSERIVHGLFKKLVLVRLLTPYVLERGSDLGTLGVLDVAIGLYAYAFYFYFDLAGYTDLAIGSARLMGMGLPENFRRPFVQRNIRQLWSCWHMSLTSWLVDYIYWPLVRRLRHVGLFRTRPLLLSIVAMNVTFVACGAWHGEAPHFILWGLYHGMGISIQQVYQRQKRKVRIPAVQAYFGSRFSHVLGVLVTFHFFVAGLTFFVLDLGELRALLSGLGR